MNKDMTQKEKFEEAKRLYETANADQRYVLESLFPELKGSEDERIRKALIEYFRWNVQQILNDFDNKEVLAWLEKLKDEQKSVDKIEPKKIKKTKFKAGDRIIGIVSGMQYYITEICDNYYRTESGCIIMFCAQENFELYKQKSAWSEEDEDYYDAIISKLEVTQDDALLTDNQMRFLKSLKDRVQPQSQWKPSDEQIKALNYVVNLMASSESPKENDYYYNVFKDLRKQLKKLREE